MSDVMDVLFHTWYCWMFGVVDVIQSARLCRHLYVVDHLYIIDHLYVVDHRQDLVDVCHLLSHQLLQLLRLAVKPEMSDTVQQKARRPISEEEMCFCSTVHVSFAFY